jgi:hypothetical protein
MYHDKMEHHATSLTKENFWNDGVTFGYNHVGMG